MNISTEQAVETIHISLFQWFGNCCFLWLWPWDLPYSRHCTALQPLRCCQLALATAAQMANWPFRCREKIGCMAVAEFSSARTPQDTQRHYLRLLCKFCFGLRESGSNETLKQDRLQFSYVEVWPWLTKFSFHGVLSSTHELTSEPQQRMRCTMLYLISATGLKCFFQLFTTHVVFSCGRWCFGGVDLALKGAAFEKMSSAHASVRQERLLDFLSSPADPEWEPGSREPVPGKLPHLLVLYEK